MQRIGGTGREFIRVITLGMILWSLSAPPGHAQQAGICAGDCDGNGQVTIGELTLGVGISLSGEGREECAVLDADSTGSVEIHEVVAALNSAICGCGGSCSDQVSPQKVELFEILPSIFPRAPTTVGPAMMADVDGDSLVDEITVVDCDVLIALGPDQVTEWLFPVVAHCALEVNVEDVNHDGWNDVVVLLDNGAIEIFQVIGGGASFVSSTSPTLGSALFADAANRVIETRAAVDLNLDGYEDSIAVIQCEVFVTFGASESAESKTVQIETHGNCATGVAVGDDDMDGAPDITILIDRPRPPLLQCI